MDIMESIEQLPHDALMSLALVKAGVRSGVLDQRLHMSPVAELTRNVQSIHVLFLVNI